MKDEEQKEEIPEIWFQTLYLKVWNPIEEKFVERIFVGKAFYNPDEIKKLGDVEIEKLIHKAEFSRPENPYMEEGNTKAYDQMLEAIREAVNAKDEEK